MIAWMKGVLRWRAEGRLVVDVGGVGYDVVVPVGVAGQVALGDSVELWVHTHVREDQIALYGFDEPGEREVFEALLAVSGVGPRIAVAAVGELGAAELALAVERGDVDRLRKVSGIGKRLAERLVVELKGKLGAAAAAGRGAAPAARGVERMKAGDVWWDLASALTHLQFRRVEIDGALDQLRAEQPDARDFDALLRAALQLLRR